MIRATVVVYLAVLALVAVQRLVELTIARRNTRRLLASGGVEVGAGHYPVMVALHAGLFVAAPLEVILAGRPFVAPLAAAMGALLLVGMALRVWVVRTLAGRWTTRIVCVPGWAPVRTGPYRWVPHPNYVGVVLEVLALPLLHTAWVTAAVFSLANLALLRVRIRRENAALQELCDTPATPHVHHVPRPR